MTDPYAVPQAALEGEQRMKTGRSVWVWVICLYFGLSAVGGVVSLYFLASGLLPMPESQASYYESLGVFDWALSGGLLLILFVACVQLFRMKRQAIGWWFATIAVGIISISYQILATQWLEAVGVAGAVMSGVGILLYLAIAMYCLRLEKRDQLS